MSISVQNVSKRFGTFTALDDVTLVEILEALLIGCGEILCRTDVVLCDLGGHPRHGLLGRGGRLVGSVGQVVNLLDCPDRNPSAGTILSG